MGQYYFVSCQEAAVAELRRKKKGSHATYERRYSYSSDDVTYLRLSALRFSPALVPFAMTKFLRQAEIPLKLVGMLLQKPLIFFSTIESQELNPFSLG